MLYCLASILFPTLAHETSKHFHFNLLNVALAMQVTQNPTYPLLLVMKMNMASLTFYTSK